SVVAQKSTLEDWQKEARKLELQGKQEQAEAIRRTILKQAPVPWPVLNGEKLVELLHKVFRERAPGAKMKQQLYEYATCHDEPQLAVWLAAEARFEQATNYTKQRATFGRKTFVPYFASHFKDILKQCEQYGIEHRLPMNQTPLMAAAAAGNLPLVDALLERGAARDAVDQYGYNALHWALREGFRDPAFATGPLAALYERLAPASIDLRTGDRLVRLDRHLAEYSLFQTLWVLFKSRFTHPQRRRMGAFEASDILDAWQHLPANIVRPDRRRRQYLSSVLARNEIDRDYAYNRGLFRRLQQGWYQFDPGLSVRRREGEEEVWLPVVSALNLPLISEVSHWDHGEWDSVQKAIDRLLALAGLPARSPPIAAERLLAVERARDEARLAATRALQAESAAAGAGAQRAIPWGSPEAKRLEIERIRQLIEARRKG
ncbi:ankyrin repeat domain-containing protein, partial [Accumulibacter sp.]